MDSTETYVDVSSSTLAVDILPSGEVWESPNDAEGVAALRDRLSEMDAIDALMLARFDEAVKLEPTRLRNKDELELSGLIARQRQIVGMLTSEKNRLKRATGRVRGDIEEHIEWLEGRKESLDE